MSLSFFSESDFRESQVKYIFGERRRSFEKGEEKEERRGEVEREEV